MTLPRFNSALLLNTWNRLTGLPKGSALFSRLIGVMVPYSGTVGAKVQSLEPGHVVVTLPDRRRVRNHLSSIHAMAMANAGELASGLAVNTAIPAEARAILTAFRIEYLKKGRGDLNVECRVPRIDSVTERMPVEATAILRDAAGVEVSRVHATWLVGPN